MMIATLALAQTDNSDVARIEAYEKTQIQLVRIEQQIRQMQQQLESTHSSIRTFQQQRNEIALINEQLEKLRTEIERVDQTLAARQRVEIVIPPIDPAAKDTLAELRDTQARLKRSIAQLKRNLADRQITSEATVSILPQGTGTDLEPYFVECAAEAIVMHHLDPPKRIRSGQGTTDEDFLKLLETVANGVDDSIVFLVRNDGLAVYRACQKLCDERQVRHGKLPVIGKGRIDLSAFTASVDPEPEPSDDRGSQP